MSHVDADGQAGRPRSVTARACSSSSLQRKRCRAVYAGIQLWAIVHTVCHFALCAGVCICIALQVRLTRSSGRCCGNLGSSCSDRGLLISTGRVLRANACSLRHQLGHPIHLYVCHTDHCVCDPRAKSKTVWRNSCKTAGFSALNSKIFTRLVMASERWHALMTQQHRPKARRMLHLHLDTRS